MSTVICPVCGDKIDPKTEHKCRGCVDFEKEPFKSLFGLAWKDRCCVCDRKIHHGGEYLVNKAVEA